MIERVFSAVLWLGLTGAALIGLEHRVHVAPPERRRADWIKYAVFVLFVATMLAVAHAGRIAVAVLVGLVSTVCARELARSVGRRWVFPASLVLFAAALGHLLAPGTRVFFLAFSRVVLVVGAADAFAQLSGRLLGRRRLCPKLSPGKTVEGLAGGFGGALVVAFAVTRPMTWEDALRVAVFALITAVAAVAGDLSFSAVKRSAGIKDFSRALPGQGGFLDRFDSLMLGAPAGYWLQRWLLP